MDYTLRFAEDQWSRLSDGLWSRDDVESAAAVICEPFATPGATALVARKILIAEPGDYRQRRPDFLELTPLWINRACRAALDRGYGVVAVHTHLHKGPTQFSWADDRGDSRLLPAMASLVAPAPVGSLVVSRDDGVARVLEGGRLAPTRVTLAGKRLVMLPKPLPAGSSGQDRQVLALGQHGNAVLRALRVGIIGLGGTGSVVHMLLRHLGITDFIVCEPDLLEESNRPRLLGSRGTDAPGIAKVSIAERLARDLQGTNAKFEVIDGPLREESSARRLVNCDAVFSCVDRLAPRALLNELAYSVHLPVIDMGSAFRVDESGRIISQGGKVAVIGPGRPCLWCWGDLDPDRLRAEALPPADREGLAAEGYVQGADLPQPSVVAFNAQLASTAVIEAMRMATGFAGADDAADRLNFDFARGTVTRVRGRSRLDCPYCGLKGTTMLDAA